MPENWISEKILTENKLSEQQNNKQNYIFSRRYI